VHCSQQRLANTKAQKHNDDTEIKATESPNTLKSYNYTSNTKFFLAGKQETKTKQHKTKATRKRYIIE
jgi:hypothetical protein